VAPSTALAHEVGTTQPAKENVMSLDITFATTDDLYVLRRHRMH